MLFRSVANGQEKYEIYLRNSTGWTRVGLEDGTIEFKEELWNYSVGNYGFDGCSKLTRIDISNNITSIGTYCFRSCTSATSVTFGNFLTNIGDNAFQSDVSLNTITFPNSVTNIGSYAFTNCTDLTNIVENLG